MFKGTCLAFALVFASFTASADDIPAPAEGSRNPPPAVLLNGYQRFELAPIRMNAPFAGQKGNEVAREKLQENLDERVGAVLKQWNEKSADAPARILLIEPEIRYIRFITGGKRFFGGGFAGASSIMVKVRLTDKETGQVVGEPDFYQHANAIGATWTFGATDKTMLIRISSMLRGYLTANYDQATQVSISEAPEVDD
jgi:hypothetical protein